MKSYDPIRRFINGVTAGMKSSKGAIHPKRDESYDIGFKAGLRNQDNDAFIEEFLMFWSDYSKFMRGETQTVQEEIRDEID